MADADPLIETMLASLRAEGGFVVVGGREFVDKRVLRRVLRACCDAFCDRVLTKLEPAVADDPETQDKLAAEVDAIARRIAAAIGQIVPTIN
jgi:hypothetical protein